jgi:TRAP-type C4-dicarboxylate transport system permease large subunit
MVVAKAAIPFLLMMTAILFLITYVPGISLLVPSLFR